MVETIINLKPPDQWRKGMTPDKLIEEMNRVLNAKMVGFSNSWTMPIKARIDMLSTGIRTPVGVKVFGPDLTEIGRILSQVESVVSKVRGTRSAFAERVSEGYYLDFDINREAIARYGLSVMDVQEVIQAAVGGVNLTQTIEGRQRYPVNVRYGRELRDDIGTLQRVLVATPTGVQVPLEELAELRFVNGPGMIKSEAAQLVGYVYVDVAGRDTGGYMNDARKAVGAMVPLPAGYRLEWSGSFEGMQRAGRRLMYVIPITLAVIFLLLYLNTRSLAKVLIVVTAVPFSLVGAFLLLWLLGLSSQCSRLGWHHRPGRSGRRDRAGDASLLGHRLRPVESGRPDERHRRPRERGHGRRRPARAAQDDDGPRDPDGPLAYHVVQRNRL